MTRLSSPYRVRIVEELALDTVALWVVDRQPPGGLHSAILRAPEADRDGPLWDQGPGPGELLIGQPTLRLPIEVLPDLAVELDRIMTGRIDTPGAQQARAELLADQLQAERARVDTMIEQLLKGPRVAVLLPDGSIEEP